MTTDAQETKSLSHVLLSAIDSRLLGLNICMPCYVLSHNSSTNMVTVQPAYKQKFKFQDDPIDLPPISNVPVVSPKMGNAHLRLPITNGDEGLLVFSQRSIDEWLEQGGVRDPEDVRTFNLSDAIFISGLHSKANPLVIKSDPACVELANVDGYMAISKDGRFQLSNGTNELFDLLVQTTEQLVTATDTLVNTTVNTALGPSPLNSASTFATIKTALEQIKTKLETLKKE